MNKGIENVKLTVRNRLVELKLTCEFANHIMDNYIRYHATQRFGFFADTEAIAPLRMGTFKRQDLQRSRLF